MTRLNPWQRQQAEQHRRRAHPHHCPRCHHPVLTGPDRDRAAIDTTINPTPVDWAHELHAHLNGTPTYLLTQDNELWDCRPHLPDTPWTGPGTIHTRHHCNEE